ncbi:MAG TPA: UBP-type zinc finger domain-containing protein [Bryobacteraceae bacterium]|nr:UBP-type zinc finger domain-containing protein [Bryobacteraceae bacterium]
MENCSHIALARDLQPRQHVCEDCVKTGDRWVHLRLCLTCGHVGCCDSSKNRHATKHYHATSHPVIRSIEPGEHWGWCYVDEMAYDLSRGVEHARPIRE